MENLYNKYEIYKPNYQIKIKRTKESRNKIFKKAIIKTPKTENQKPPQKLKT